MKRKVIKRIILFIALIIVSGWILIFFSKDYFLGVAIHKAQGKLKDKYKLDLNFKKYALHGWTEVVMDGMNCQNQDHDTVVYLEHIQLNIKLWPLITGRLRLEKMNLEGGLFDLGQIRKLRKKGTQTEEVDSNHLSKAQKYLRLIKDAAHFIPDNFFAKNIGIRYTDSSGNINGIIDSVSYMNSNVSSKSELSIDGQHQVWIVEGTFDNSSLETHLKVNSNVTGFYNLSMIKKIASAQIGFRSYNIDIDNLDDNGDNVSIKGGLKADHILVYNPRISADTISADSGGIDFSVRITDKKWILDSTSRIHINGLSAMISSDYTYVYPATIHAKLELAPMPAQSILDAMPTGAFEAVHSMTMEGNMGYHFDFFLAIDKKDTVNIDAQVINKGLKILNYGSVDLRKINGNFTYHPYNSRRPIQVDSANPSYTSLSAMPKYLTDAVVSSEDPEFYYNKGIDESAIETSVLENLKQHRFRQGGSTITMQLVKNVFLTHQKTIDRKLEEFFLVWLLENTHIARKNRILEVYLNIIEWGPDVYGIGEASKFYFNKKPSQLTLDESIFLVKIIPQPLGFMNRFDSQGKLKENFQKKAMTTVDRMARRGKLDIEAQGSYWPEVRITGPAKNLIKISPVSDSLRVQDSISRATDW